MDGREKPTRLIPTHEVKLKFFHLILCFYFSRIFLSFNLNVIHHLIWFGSAEKKFVLLLFLFFSSSSLLLLFFSANVCFLKISTGVSGIFLNTWIKIAHLLFFDFILLTIRKMIKVWLTSWKDADFFKIKSSNSFEELSEKKSRENFIFLNYHRELNYGLNSEVKSKGD